jgi:hypothetical protein
VNQSCQSCNMQKNELHVRRSKLIKGITILMCQTCIDKKFEPRWIIIIHGRQNGAYEVQDYITKHRYVGEDIKAVELMAIQV